MNFKINTVADRIRSNFTNPRCLSNMQEFAKSQNMLLHSLSLQDGTTIKLLANAIEFDCLIMKNGKVLTARGCCGTPDDVASAICGFFNHMQKRKDKLVDCNLDYESFAMIDDYLTKYDKLMVEV